MGLAVIIMEDHLAQNFRPLGWSVPVYEMPCGLFNLRERVELHLRKSGSDYGLGLLPHSLLEPLAALTRTAETAVGSRQCLDLVDHSEQTLLISARLKGLTGQLSDLLAEDSPEYYWADDFGFLAWKGPSSAAATILESWREWDQQEETRSGWRIFSARVPEFSFPGTVEKSGTTAGWGYLWERIDELGRFIAADTRFLIDASVSFRRSVFGIRSAVESPQWQKNTILRAVVGELYPGVNLVNPQDIHQGDDVRIAPGSTLDASKGPIVLDRGAKIMANAYLEGPLYIGAGTIVKACSTIYGETAIGPVCRVSGEIAESQLSAFVNKQHAGFLGHAVVGSWVNLGADTTCSDLKNNYGLIKVNFGQGSIAGDSRFIGLLMAEHAKSAIGTTFNTATTVGFSANVFAPGFPRSVIPNFSWGDGRQKSFEVEKAIEVARIVMERRDCVFLAEHGELFQVLNPV